MATPGRRTGTPMRCRQAIARCVRGRRGHLAHPSGPPPPGSGRTRPPGRQGRRRPCGGGADSHIWTLWRLRDSDQSNRGVLMAGSCTIVMSMPVLSCSNSQRRDSAEFHGILPREVVTDTVLEVR